MGFAGLRARRASSPPPFPFDNPTLSIWYNGRAAIWQGLKRLGLKAGDTILAPAYSCGSEIDALVKAGLTVVSYRSLPDLSPDLDHLEELVKLPAQALFVTHFFGYPQPMAPLTEFARRNNLLVIEDATHGLYSLDRNGKPVGASADLSVFSFPKFLPLTDGGGYVLGSAPAGADQAASSRAPKAAAVAGKLKGMAESEMLRRFPVVGTAIKTHLTNPLVEFLKRRLYPDYRPQPGGDIQSAFGGRTLELDRADWNMSVLSKFLLDRVDHGQIAPARQRNYRTLDARFEADSGGRGRVRPLLKALPEGACPWLYPVWADNPTELRAFMAANRIECGLFWTEDHSLIPLDDFPFERELRQHVATLPVRQGLTTGNMIAMADLLNQWNRQTA